MLQQTNSLLCGATAREQLRPLLDEPACSKRGTEPAAGMLPCTSSSPRLLTTQKRGYGWATAGVAKGALTHWCSGGCSGKVRWPARQGAPVPAKPQLADCTLVATQTSDISPGARSPAAAKILHWSENGGIFPAQRAACFLLSIFTGVHSPFAQLLLP